MFLPPYFFADWNLVFELTMMGAIRSVPHEVPHYREPERGITFRRSDGSSVSTCDWTAILGTVIAASLWRGSFVRW